MGLHTVLENDNRCYVGWTRKPVHPSQHQCLESEEKDGKNKCSNRNYFTKNLNADLQEMDLDASSPYRRSLPSRPLGIDVQDEVTVRRGSVYLSSREVRKMKKLQINGRKINFDENSEDFLSFEIVNSSSLQSLDERKSSSQKKRPPDKNPILTSVDSTGSVLTNKEDCVDLSFRFLSEEQCTSNNLTGSATYRGGASDNLFKSPLPTKELSCCSTENSAENHSLEASMPSRTDGNLLSEWDKRHFLLKSFSAKGGSHTSFDLPDDDSLRDGPKIRFSPRKGMLDPIMKSKSQRNPSLSEAEVVDTPKNDSGSIKKNKAFHRSLLSDFSRATQWSQNKENDSQCDTRDRAVRAALSPVHLSAVIKLEKRNGAMFIEFLPSDSEDFLSAKAWRTNNAFNRVYTFHRSKKKNSSNGWGVKDRHTLPSLIGQMKVCCHLCSKVDSNQSLDNSIVMEFTLFDIAQARRSSAGEGKSHTPTQAMQSLKTAIDDGLATSRSSKKGDFLSPEKRKIPPKLVVGNGESDASDPHPWSPADLLPCLEIAAIVIQFPCEMMKGNLRNMKEDKENSKEYSELCSISTINEDSKDFTRSSFPANVKVITPSGSHGLPCTEACPSPLLDRWRSGGGCDCGGWDMGCPIVVFDSNICGRTTDSTTHQFLEIFAQGTKCTIPDLTMTNYEEGHYSVQFHAKLSALQAFSICVSTLHALEPSTMTRQETIIPMLHTKSLKLLLEGEVRHLLGAVAETEKVKTKKGSEEPLPARYVLDPPFSPIGRV